MACFIVLLLCTQHIHAQKHLTNVADTLSFARKSSTTISEFKIDNTCMQWNKQNIEKAFQGLQPKVVAVALENNMVVIEHLNNFGAEELLQVFANLGITAKWYDASLGMFVYYSSTGKLVHE